MNTIHGPLCLITVCAGALWLGACDKPPPEPPVANASVPDPSVPPAETVRAPAEAASADPTAARSNTPLSAAQESAAMPLPGQNNDHSAPAAPAERASAP